MILALVAGSLDKSKGFRSLASFQVVSPASACYSRPISSQASRCFSWPNQLKIPTTSRSTKHEFSKNFPFNSLSLLVLSSPSRIEVLLPPPRPMAAAPLPPSLARLPASAAPPAEAKGAKRAAKGRKGRKQSEDDLESKGRRKYLGETLNSLKCFSCIFAWLQMM